MMPAALARFLWVGVASLGLAACAGMPGVTEGGPGAGQKARGLAELLAQTDYLAGQPIEEQKREITAAQAEFERDPVNEWSRLRLALALTLPRVPGQQEAQTLALLADWPATGEDSLPREVVLLVHRLILERLRLLKDEQRRFESLRDEHRRVDVSLRETQRKIEELQQKLDALRAIDRDSRRHLRR